MERCSASFYSLAHIKKGVIGHSHYRETARARLQLQTLLYFSSTSPASCAVHCFSAADKCNYLDDRLFWERGQASHNELYLCFSLQASTPLISATELGVIPRGDFFWDDFEADAFRSS